MCEKEKGSELQRANTTRGYSRKNPHPHNRRHGFLSPPPPIQLDFQNCLSPTPLRISKSQFSVNSVFVVNVKITFSHLLKQAYTFANKLIFE